MGDIEAVCDRTIFLDEGKVYYDGKLSDFVKEHGKDVLIFIDSTDQSDGSSWEEFGSVIERNDSQIKLRVKKDNISLVKHKLADDKYVTNYMIREMDAEDIVRDFYEMEKKYESA